MTTTLTILEIWAAASFIGTPILLALIKAKRIQFYEIVDRSEFDRGWGPRP